MSKRTEQSRKLGPLPKRHLHVVTDLGSHVPEVHAVRATPPSADELPLTALDPAPSSPKGGVVG
jgi:hypothetical protein